MGDRRATLGKASTRPTVLECLLTQPLSSDWSSNMFRSFPAVFIAMVVLVGAPVAATVVTATVASNPLTIEASADATHSESGLSSPAVVIWGITGLAGVAAMIGFGATVGRRGARRSEAGASPIELSAEPTRLYA